MLRPMVNNARNENGFASMASISFIESGNLVLVNRNINASPMAKNGGNTIISFISLRGLVCFWAYQKPVKTPTVLQTTNVPARERIIPIARPFDPKNISKMGKPANETLPIPEVIMSTARVFLSIGFIKLTSSKKRKEKP